VAFVVGGDPHGSSAQLYSPNGKCRHRLAQIPIGDSRYWHIPALALVENGIVACGGHTSSTKNTECWLYNIASNVWTVYSNSVYTHIDKSGAVYKNKIYLQDPVHPEVFDPVTKKWNVWPKPPVNVGDFPCLLAWRDSFFLIGGSSGHKTVLQFHHTTQIWAKLDASSLPMEIETSGCAVLPNEDILVVGSENSPYLNSVALYNVAQNKWRSLGETTYGSRRGTSLVKLGERVFAIGGFTNVTEEFIVKDNTWLVLDTQLMDNYCRYHTSLSVPASLFAHLEGGCEGVL